MKSVSCLSSKGQVTVPIAIRKRLGVRGGDRLRFVVEGGEVKLQPDRTEENPFRQFIGALCPKGQKDGTAVAWVRSIRDEGI